MRLFFLFLFFGFVFFAVLNPEFGVVKAAVGFSNKMLGSAGRSDVHRIVDNETGVVCYVVPKEHCNGDCAYSPAIACIKL